MLGTNSEAKKKLDFRILRRKVCSDEHIKMVDTLTK